MTEVETISREQIGEEVIDEKAQSADGESTDKKSADRESADKKSAGKKNTGKKKKHPLQFLFNFLIKTALLAAAVFLVITFVAVPFRATGNTMSPFVRDGDLCIFYRLDQLTTNSVVLYEDESGETRVGRIVAVPGQTVDLPENGGFTVDDYIPAEEIPYETYAAEASEVSFPLTLGEEEYFIMNDYRSLTNDSREFGAVESSRIRGKLLFLFRRRDF